MTLKRKKDDLEVKFFRKLRFLHNHHFAFVILFILLIVISIQKFEYTGYSIFYVDEVIEEELNLVFNSSYNYNSIIDVENFDHIKSLKLTGRVAKEGIVKVYFNDILVLDNSALVNNENKVTGLSILNESLNETSEVVENVQDYILIDLDYYCLDSCNLFVNNFNVNLNFEIENSILEVDEITYTVVKAENELEPVTNTSEVTLNDGIIVEEDIEWTKIIELDEVGRVNVSLPSLARNIRVKKLIDDNEVEVSKDRYDIDDSNLIDLVNPIVVNIYDDALKYKIYYDTPGPDKTESALIKDKYKLLKNISVSSELDLQNITSYVDLPNVLRQQIKLRWFDENSSTWVDITGNETYNLTYYDSNDDGKIERVYWNIPHLSDQEFSLEINLLILNVQSYPVVGGNWTVNFNTTGTANLTIEAFDGTSWSNSEENRDLRFMELKCGSNLVNYSWINDKVFVDNYNCDGLTSIEVSKVISGGSHHLKFTFGNLVGYADNFAYAPNHGLLVYGHNNETCSSRTYSTSGTWTNPTPCIAIDSGYVPKLINLYSSKTRNETIMLMKTFSSAIGQQAIYAHIWNGTNWANMTNFVLGELRSYPAQYRKYDGCYLKNGDFMAVYGHGEEDTTNITYARIWNGTVWTNNFTVYSSYGGNVLWVDVRCNRDRNEAMIAVIDQFSGTIVNHASTIFFNNTSGYTSNSFGFFKQHVGNPPDVRWEQIDLDWSNNDSTQGIFMYVNGTSPTTSIGVTWNATNGNLTYGQGFVSPTFGYTVGDVIIRPHPNNETFNNSFLVGVSRGNIANPSPVDAYLIHNYTPGFSTIVSGNVTNSSDNGQQRDFDIAWEKTGGEALMVFNFSVGSSLHYRLYNVTNGSTSEMKYGGVMMNAINNEVLILKPDPLSSEEMMLVVLDTVQNIGTMLWNGTSNTFSAVTQQGTSTGLGDVDFWADFEWNRFTNGSLGVLFPNWSTPAINQSAVYNNQWINFSTIWSDDTGLSSYILEINQTGSYINSTPRAFPTTGTLQNSSNITKIVAGADANITWRFYVNDSGNNWNNTALQSFIVKGFVPNVTLSIPDNLQVVQPTNIFFQCNVSDDQQIINVTLYSNATQMCTGNAVACSMFSASSSECNAQLGCTWGGGDPPCEGTAIACNNVNATYCQTQSGCNLFSANKTIDVREIYDGYPGLVLMYHLNNESTTGNENNTLVHDYSGNNNDALIASVILGATNPLNISGKFGSGMSFRGAGVVPDYINASDSSSLDITGNVTVMAWVYRRETSSSGNVASKFSDTCASPFTVYNLEVRNGIEAAFGVTSGGARTVLVTSNDDLQNDTWHHLVGMYNSTHISIWVDGVQKAIQAYSTLPLDTSNAQFAVGRSVLCDNFQLNATVDEIAVFNRSFTPQQIYDFYNYTKKNYSANYTLTNLNSGAFGWNCLATDKDANISFQSINWTFTVSANPNVTLSFPANNSNHLGDNISFQCNVTDDIEISNLTLYHNMNGTFVANITRDYGEVDSLSGSDGYVLIYHLNNDSRFGENDTYAYDFSKNNNNGTFTRNSWLYPQVNYTGKFGNNLLFALGDPEIQDFGFVNISGRSSTLNISTNQVTVMAWINQDAGNTGKEAIIAKVINSSGPPAYTYGLYYDGGPIIGTVHKGNGFITAWTASSTADGFWYHVAMTFNGTTLKVFKGGYLTGSNSSGSGGLNATGPGDLRIGSQGQIDTSFIGRIDEVVILNRSLSDEEVFQHYNRSLGMKSASENFTFTNIVNLTGLFRWNCLAYDNNSQLDWADANWTFNFNTSVPPSVTTGPTLTPNNPTTIHDLNCSFVVTDQDYWNTLYANVSWRRNDTLMFAFNISVPNGAAAQNILHNANTTKFDTWNCTVTPFDGTSYGTNISAALGILNNFPDNVTMIYPANGSNVQDRRPLFNWTNSTDPDNDRFNFTILIDDNIDFSSPEINVSTYATNFTPTNPLILSGGGNTRYFWTVTAYDDTNRTAFNETVTYTFLLQSIVQIAIRNNTVGFVGLNPLQNDDTLDDSPYPFTVENDGTTMINVNISQINSDLWRTQASPTGYFMYKISNYTGEEGAFSWAGSVTTFTNVPIVNATAIWQLNFTNSTDIARVEINVTVPSSEPAGDRSTNLSFTAIIAGEEISE